MFSRSSVGEIGVNIREDTETSILIKRTFSFLYYCFNISKVTCAAKPLFFRLKVRGERLKAGSIYRFALNHFMLSPEGGVCYSCASLTSSTRGRR